RYIITTLNTLKDAKELPELFMKSNEEIILWRMLRRVSDQIKLELDNPILDDAREVQEYRIKDIQVKLLKDNNELLFIKNNIKKSIELDNLIKKPTSVFRMLIEMVQL